MKSLGSLASASMAANAMFELNEASDLRVNSLVRNAATPGSLLPSSSNTRARVTSHGSFKSSPADCLSSGAHCSIFRKKERNEAFSSPSRSFFSSLREVAVVSRPAVKLPG